MLLDGSLDELLKITSERTHPASIYRYALSHGWYVKDYNDTRVIMNWPDSLRQLRLPTAEIDTIEWRRCVYESCLRITYVEMIPITASLFKLMGFDQRLRLIIDWGYRLEPTRFLTKSADKVVIYAGGKTYTVHLGNDNYYKEPVFLTELNGAAIAAYQAAYEGYEKSSLSSLYSIKDPEGFLAYSETAYGSFGKLSPVVGYIDALDTVERFISISKDHLPPPTTTTP